MATVLVTDRHKWNNCKSLLVQLRSQLSWKSTASIIDTGVPIGFATRSSRFCEVCRSNFGISDLGKYQCGLFAILRSSDTDALAATVCAISSKFVTDLLYSVRPYVF